MTLAANGDILTANGNDGNMVVTKPNSAQSGYDLSVAAQTHQLNKIKPRAAA